MRTEQNKGVVMAISHERATCDLKGVLRNERKVGYYGASFVHYLPSKVTRPSESYSGTSPEGNCFLKVA